MTDDRRRKAQKLAQAELTIIKALESYDERYDKVAEQLIFLEDNNFNLNHMIGILMSVFNAGREAGLNELKKRIADL